MISLGLREPPRCVLCVGAHSDDIEIGCAGLLLTLAADHPGARFVWVIATGDEARRAEADSSAASLLPDGRAPEVRHLGLRDGHLPYRPGETKDALAEACAGLDPDIVLTHNRDDLHQDHRCLGELALQLFRDALILEYEVPKYDGDLGRPNLHVALDDAIADRKVAHLMAHFASQRDKRWFTPELFNALMRVRGMEAGLAGGRAESFYARKARLL